MWNIYIIQTKNPNQHIDFDFILKNKDRKYTTFSMFNILLISTWFNQWLHLLFSDLCWNSYKFVDDVIFLK